MNILILHNMEKLSAARTSQLNEFLAYERYASEHNYLYHRITLPVTNTIYTTPWDAVLLTSTALGVCTFRPRNLFLEQKDKWAFLKEIPAVKAVFPQDDAECGRLMDDWFFELNCDLIYCVRPEFTNLIYPRSSVRAQVVPTMSGFVDDLSIKSLRSFAKPFDKRTLDIGQRVTLHPPHGGRHSRLKGVTALEVRRAALAKGLAVDISVKENDVFVGMDWYRFLGECRFVLGAEGGMSLWDPVGAIKDRIDEYLSRHPNASFEEIESACFPGEDGRYVFTGFSPRIFEAALMECCQILVEGDYRGILRPYEHYIPLRKDCSNVDEVFSLMEDRKLVLQCIERTYEELIASPKYRYSEMVNGVIGDVQRRLHIQRPKSNELDFGRAKVVHQLELEDAVVKHAEAEGFSGDSLTERVDYLLGDHYAEPLVFKEYNGPSMLFQYRSSLRHRIATYVARHS